jgi:D-alanine-D-alanine ligase
MAEGMMRVGLIYDVFEDYPWREGEARDADVEYEPIETVEALEDAVRLLGYQPVRIGTAFDLLERLPSFDIDLAINITESAHTRNREAYAPILLEMAGVPCVGSDALTLSLSLDKAWTKDLAIATGIPTPPYRTYRTSTDIDPDDLPSGFPLFVKARYEGSSKGILPSSKVHSMGELTAEVDRVAKLYRQDVIVEPFVSGGGEFTVAVVGHDPPRALPVLQRAVEASSGIGLHALERRGTDFADLDYRIEGSLVPELEQQLHDMSLRIFRKLDCRDFARIDFRVDEDGRPWFLEINPLPTFAPDGTFAIAAELIGQNYTDFLAEVLGEAIERAIVESSSAQSVRRMPTTP